MAVTYLSLLAVAFASCISVSWASEFCTNENYSILLCRYGCCGTSPYQTCCSISVGAIVGGVIGAIVFICFLISLCCICARRRRQTVVRTYGANPYAGNVSVVSNNTQQQQQQQQAQYGYNQQPPPYAPAGPPAQAGYGYPPAGAGYPPAGAVNQGYAPKM